MNAKEIRKLQRNKRSAGKLVREAISYADACAFAAPGPRQKERGEPGIAQWAARWTLMFEEYKTKIEQSAREKITTELVNAGLGPRSTNPHWRSPGWKELLAACEATEQRIAAERSDITRFGALLRQVRAAIVLARRS